MARNTKDKSAPQASGAVLDGALEAVVYAIMLLALVSRATLPEIGLLSLCVALAAVACVPPFLMSERREAGTVSRIAIAMCIGLLVQLRLPIMMPGTTFLSPLEEPMSVSVTGLVATALGVLLIVRWLREREPVSMLGRVCLGTAATLAVGVVVMWALLSRGLLASGGQQGMFYAETLGSICILAQYTAIILYALSIKQPSRQRRLAAVSAVLLLARGFLPESGVV